MKDVQRIALELALDLEKRGSLEGHYVWSDMLIKALTNAYDKGWSDGCMMVKENLLTPNLCKNVMDCVKVCDNLVEYQAF